MITVFDEREPKDVVTIEELREGDFFLFNNMLWLYINESCCVCKNLTNNYEEELNPEYEVEIPDLEIRIKKK